MMHVKSIFLLFCLTLTSAEEETCKSKDDDCQMVNSTSRCKYDAIPITPTFGAEITGISLKFLEQDCAEKLKQEAFMNRFLVFKKQPMTWQEQIRVMSLFGTPHEETKTPNRKQHDKIPDPRLAYFSNDPSEGLTGNGIEGWHSDGNTVEVPHMFTFVYCIKANKNGPTLVVPLKEIVDMLSDDERNYLENIQFVSGFNASVTHPLLYKHAYRKDDTIMLALGTLSGQYLQKDGEEWKTLSVDETQFIMDILLGKILSSNLIYAMHYEPGDLLIMNNHAVAHIAGPGSQLSSAVSGVRLMARSTVRGETRPSKSVNMDFKCANFSPYEDGYCIFSLKDSVFYPRVGYFDSQPVARQRCKNFNKFADLATIHSEEWNDLIKPIITKTGHPHWINASNPEGRHIFWGNEEGKFSNWDPEQPNDHGGVEDCVVLGPFAKWYDLPCSGPKTTDEDNRAPVIVWEDGIRKMLNVYPLCGIARTHLGSLV